MKRLSPLVLLAVVACQEPVEGDPVSRIEIGKGEITAKPSPTPSVRAKASACRSETFEGVAMTRCVADPTRHRIAMALDAPDGDPARSFNNFAETLAEPDGVVFAVNGGMFDEAGEPIGYYVEDGRRRRKLNRANGPGNFHLKPNGVFFGTGGKWRVLTSDAFYATVGERPEFGTQSGPMLVIAGKLHPEIAEEGPSKLVRNGVGVDAAGRAHFVLSEGPVSFGRFARYFRDRLKTPNALYLDGTVSALWDPRAGRRDETVPLGPLIVVTDKDIAE